MKYFLISLFILFISGCAGGHYYVRDDDPNRTMKVLYENEKIWIAINAMNGTSSSLMFAARTEEHVSVKVESVTLSIEADGNNVEPATSTIAPRSITLSKGQMYSMRATYQFVTPPEEVRAKIELRVTSGGDEVLIDEIISLSIVEYGFWEALMSI